MQAMCAACWCFTIRRARRASARRSCAANLKRVYPLPDLVRTVPATALGEVRQPKYPANLLELGYHDNYADAAWVENNMDAIARELARSLTEYFGLPFIEPQPVVQGTVSTSGSPLRLRAYPSAAGQTIALMPNGASVTVYGTWQGWNTVEYNGNLGYAAEAYIES